MILLRHIIPKFHEFDYTGTFVYPKSVVLRSENYGDGNFCILHFAVTQFTIPSLFPVIFDIDYADLFQTEVYYRRYK